MKKESRIFLTVTCVILIIFYSIFFRLVDVWSVDVFVKLVTTTTTLIAALAFWWQFYRTRKLNEASYIKDLNNQFITNNKMTAVEHQLEIFYNQVCAGEDISEIKNFEYRNMDRNDSKCQDLINYLVYLESMAAMVKCGVLHMEDIEDVFSYRFFIAVNNPVVQKEELFPYKDFYKGCYWLAKEWTKTSKYKNRVIPMEEYSLERMEKEYYETKILVRAAEESDNLEEIGRCLYLTDPFIYPAAFGEEKNKAAKAIAFLIKNEAGIFTLPNITVAVNSEDGSIVGAALTNKSGKEYSTAKAANLCEQFLTSPGDFTNVFNNYFNKHAFSGKNAIEIVACSVLPTHRSHGIGKKLLTSVIADNQNKDIILEVLEDNNSAIRLYHSLGFQFSSSARQGFSINPKDKPLCRMMKISRKE